MFRRVFQVGSVVCCPDLPVWAWGLPGCFPNTNNAENVCVWGCGGSWGQRRSRTCSTQPADRWRVMAFQCFLTRGLTLLLPPCWSCEQFPGTCLCFAAALRGKSSGGQCAPLSLLWRDRTRPRDGRIADPSQEHGSRMARLQICPWEHGHGTVGLQICLWEQGPGTAGLQIQPWEHGPGMAGLQVHPRNMAL